MLPADLTAQRIGIWGTGVEGLAAARTALGHDAASIMVVDSAAIAAIAWTDALAADPELAQIPVHTGPDSWQHLLSCDIAIVSPGISRYSEPVRQLRAAGVTLTGGSALAVARRPDRVIAVTGSKGKSTTASLIAWLLAQLDHDVHLGGNVGKPLLSLPAPHDTSWHIAELSSYQLADLTVGPAIGAVTSLFPDHLDWHGDFNTYAADKLRLVTGTSSAHQIIIPATDALLASQLDRLGGTAAHARRRDVGTPETIHANGGHVHVADQRLLSLQAVTLPGAHNMSNICVALTALQAAGIDLHEHAEQLQRALETFTPLPHRLEVVATVNGAQYIDDTLSTTAQSAAAALSVYRDRHVVLIAGGADRGIDYRPLADALLTRRSPTDVICIADSGPRIADAIGEARAQLPAGAELTTHRCDDLARAVTLAGHLTAAGSVVLLSPAAPSYGVYRNYQAKAAHYLELVRTLPASA